jgi:glycosyltransferase involved in cell wall biosynthesis
MARLTIVIPTVNRADLLSRAIESALAQTSPDIEIIVSDNGSTDETPAVIERYANRGLRTFRHPTIISAAKHGQFLVEQAKGEYFLGLSDDDFLEPDFAAEVLAAFDRHPESAFVYTGCAVHYEDIQVPAAVGPPLESGADFLAQHYAGKREVCWCACVTRTKHLLEINPQLGDRIIGDMFYWTKLAFKGSVACVPRVLSHYSLLRSRNDNISHGTSPMVWARESRLLADEVIAASRDAGASPEYLSSLERACKLHIARSTANQFIWTRIRGAKLSDALAWSIPSLSYLAWTFPAASRFAAALLLPPSILRRLLLSGAAKLADSRRANLGLEVATPAPQN